MNSTKLIDKKELIEKHPALGAKRYRLDWLVRSRKIPCVKIGKLVFFDEEQINKWIKEQRIDIHAC